VPCAISALPEARTMPDRSPERDPILATEHKDLWEFGESPSVPEQGWGLSRIRHA
jgi:hypothetical protein